MYRLNHWLCHFVAIPYVQGTSEKIKFELKRHNITLVGRGDHNLKKYLFSTLKDKVPITLSIECNMMQCSYGNVDIGLALW